jgi:hypothetical protein
VSVLVVSERNQVQARLARPLWSVDDVFPPIRAVLGSQGAIALCCNQGEFMVEREVGCVNQPHKIKDSTVLSIEKILANL